MSELLLINLLTSLLLALQQAFVVQAEPFTPSPSKEELGIVTPDRAAAYLPPRRPSREGLPGRG